MNRIQPPMAASVFPGDEFTREQRRFYPLIYPDSLIEVLSASDSLKVLETKMLWERQVDERR